MNNISSSQSAENQRDPELTHTYNQHYSFTDFRDFCVHGCIVRCIRLTNSKVLEIKSIYITHKILFSKRTEHTVQNIPEIPYDLP